MLVMLRKNSKGRIHLWWGGRDTLLCTNKKIKRSQTANRKLS